MPPSGMSSRHSHPRQPSEMVVIFTGAPTKASPCLVKACTWAVPVAFVEKYVNVHETPVQSGSRGPMTPSPEMTRTRNSSWLKVGTARPHWSNTVKLHVTRLLGTTYFSGQLMAPPVRVSRVLGVMVDRTGLLPGSSATVREPGTSLGIRAGLLSMRLNFRYTSRSGCAASTSSLSLFSWISAAVRIDVQTRNSSISPTKLPVPEWCWPMMMEEPAASVIVWFCAPSPGTPSGTWASSTRAPSK
mmetsp:Transcript_163/g.430  ORF Transcript_163/g.430 Transcript_163/m.430 type:complete len:244 (+) Transcript_163:420-1151(+)